jgi:DNA polymerase III epsilon subunit family exonuclease
VAGWRDLPLVGLDTETTGLSVVEDRIFEIAVVTFEGGCISDPFCELMDPTRPLSDAAALKTGVTDSDLAGRPTFAHFAPEILRRIEGRIVVGYNLIGYDMPLLKAELARVGLELPDCHMVDVLIFARALMPGGRHRLEEAVRHFAVPMDNAHRASADAEATVRLLLAMAKDLPSELPDLLRLQAQWQAEQRAKRAMWRSKPSQGSREVLRGDMSPGAGLLDDMGRPSLGPSYLYGKEIDPLRAFLQNWFNSLPARDAAKGEGGIS